MAEKKIIVKPSNIPIAYRGTYHYRDGFTAAGIPMPKVENFCGGVRVSVERTKFKEMTNDTDNDTDSLCKIMNK